MGCPERQTDLLALDWKHLDNTGEYYTKKFIFCHGPRQRLSFFAEEIFGIFKIKLQYFWTICDKNA